MVVGLVIQEKLLESGLGFELEGMRIPVLFYADDRMIMVRSRMEVIRMMEETAGRCGLKINKDKTVGMAFKSRSRNHGMGEIAVTEELRYLGVKVVPKRDCFGEKRNEKVRLARKLENLTYSVIARACDRLLVGKTFWKSVVLPSVLSSGEVMVWSKNKRESLQRIENGVWSKVFFRNESSIYRNEG